MLLHRRAASQGQGAASHGSRPPQHFACRAGGIRKEIAKGCVGSAAGFVWTRHTIPGPVRCVNTTIRSDDRDWTWQCMHDPRKQPCWLGHLGPR